jgi:hypothetical protein
MGHDRFMGIFLRKSRDFSFGYVGRIGDDEIIFPFAERGKKIPLMKRDALLQIMILHVDAGYVEGIG